MQRNTAAHSPPSSPAKLRSVWSLELVTHTLAPAPDPPPACAARGADHAAPVMGSSWPWRSARSSPDSLHTLVVGAAQHPARAVGPGEHRHRGDPLLVRDVLLLLGRVGQEDVLDMISSVEMPLLDEIMVGSGEEGTAQQTKNKG